MKLWFRLGETRMADVSKSVKTLRAFWKDRQAEIDGDALFEEMKGTSDRAVVIVLGAFMDDALQFVLARLFRRMPDAEYETAFGPNGPLGPFSSRIDMAYWLSAIDEKTREKLHDLRELRNACAHSKRSISFKDKALANVAKRVIGKTGMTPLESDTPIGIRNTLITDIFLEFNFLVHGRDVTFAMVKEAAARHRAEAENGGAA